MGKLTTIAFMGFIISFMLFIGGDSADGTRMFLPDFIVLYQDITDPSVNLVDAIINTLLTPEVLIGGAITSIVAVLSGFALNFIIPALLLGAVANFLLIPTTAINSLGLPPEISIFIIGVMQLLLVMGYLEFIRGANT